MADIRKDDEVKRNARNLKYGGAGVKANWFMKYAPDWLSNSLCRAKRSTSKAKCELTVKVFEPSHSESKSSSRITSQKIVAHGIHFQTSQPQNPANEKALAERNLADNAFVNRRTHQEYKSGGERIPTPSPVMPLPANPVTPFEGANAAANRADGPLPKNWKEFLESD